MYPALADQTSALNLANILLGLACLAVVAIVFVAAFLDVRERRRWRAMIPDCWPPPGVDPADAYVDASAGETPAEPTSPGPRRA